MDISTGLGLLARAIVVTTLIMLGGDFGMFYSEHALIVIFGGSCSATLIRFPLSSIFHGLPLGAKFAFTMRRMGLRELVDEIAGFAEIVRKQGPIGLEKVEVDDPFLAKAVRFVADGYDTDFIPDNLERDRDNFLTHLDGGQKIYRAVGDCAPAFGMIGTLVGMVQMFANMTDPSKLGPFMATALLATLYGVLVAFSTQDKQKLQIVAGSMRDAFGVETQARYSSIVEVDGLPTRPKLKHLANIAPEQASQTPTPDDNGRERDTSVKLPDDKAFALAPASLRQALQSLPELNDLSKQVMVEETRSD